MHDEATTARRPRARSWPARLSLLLWPLLLVGGCNAHFVDELAPPAEGGGDASIAGDGRADLATDGSGGGEGYSPDGDADGGGADAPDAGVFARGDFAGRGGYEGHGSAALRRDSQGSVTVELSSAFSTSSVPGPVVVLSSRDAIGSALEPDTDVELGVLQALSGAQSYPVPGGDGGRRYVWIYCKPFGVEVARAALEKL